MKEKINVTAKLVCGKLNKFKRFYIVNYKLLQDN